MQSTIYHNKKKKIEESIYNAKRKGKKKKKLPFC